MNVEKIFIQSSNTMPRTRSQRARTEEIIINFPRTSRATTVQPNQGNGNELNVRRRRQGRVAVGRSAIGRFVRSNKGKKVLVCDGFSFNLNSKAKGTAYWRCVKGGKNGICTGTARTTVEALSHEGSIDVTLLQDHLHHRDNTEIVVQDLVRNLRSRAEAQPNVAPANLIRDIVSGIRDEEVLHRLPARETLARNVRRVQARTRPPNLRLFIQSLH